jgi:tetratricopeptide (TPR) repeat protein
MRALILVCLILATRPPAVAAQPVMDFGSGTADADLLYFAGRPREAYDVLEGRLEADPRNYDLLWRAARAAVMVGMEEEGIERQNWWFDPAIVLGDRAVAERPQGLEGLHWRGAAEGRRAINAGPNYAADLVQRVSDDARAILAIDPDHCGAHNMLGKMNYEIMILSGIERFFGRMLVGTQALRDSNWEEAEEHLEAAVLSCPDMVVFRFDLGELYRKRGRVDQAREALRKATELPPLHPIDPFLQREALRHLEELDS